MFGTRVDSRFTQRELARKRLASVKDEIKSRVVRVETDDADNFEFEYGWEEKHVKWFIVEFEINN